MDETVASVMLKGASMTSDAERADKLAALRARRSIPRRKHAAAGTRIAATGLAASAVIGLTGVIAMANKPAGSTASEAAPTALSGTPTQTDPVPSTRALPTVVSSVVP